MKSRIVLLIGALAIMFSIVAFAIPFARNEGFWVAYGFGLLAIISQLYFMQSAFRQGGSARSKVYGFPIARVGVAYLSVQFVASVIEMVCADWVPLWVYLVLDVIVLCLALAGCVAAEAARDEVVRQDADGAASTAAIIRLRAGIQVVLARCEDCSARTDVGCLAEALRFSDPVSHEETIPLEDRLLASMEDLSAATAHGDEERMLALTREMLVTVEERNTLCRLSK